MTWHLALVLDVPFKVYEESVIKVSVLGQSIVRPS